MKSPRRLLRVLGWIVCAVLGVTVCEAQSPPVRILPLGDSLTSGTTAEGAYRNRLYSLLTTAGYNVDFVGTRADVNNPTLPDRDHQGMGGYRIDQIQSGLASWLDAIEDPDVVLLLIGTNDFSQNFNTATAQNRLSALIADVAAQRPFAKIIVSNLPLRTDSPALEALQSAYNATIPGIINDQVALGRQVSFVDMHSVLAPADFAEGVHPTIAGYEKMADAWLPSITGVIAPTGTTNPPAIVRTEPAVDLQHVSIRFSKPLADSAANPANFSINGGLTISQAVLDPVSKRIITLTTTPQVPGALYTIGVSGVRDRTPQQNLIAGGATVSYSSFTLANGSFEDGQTGWSMTGNYLVYDTTPPYAASKGVKMVVLNGGQSPPTGVVSQTFATVPGQYYVLGYDVGFLALNNGELKLGVEVTGAASLFSRIDSVFGNSLGNSVWTGKTASFIADGPSTTLTFRDLSASTDGRDLLLDNVRVSAAAPPVNAAPLALADSYSTNQNVALFVPAAGVLANDSDAESSPLSAVLDAAPAHGSLVLNADGSFTYTPATGFSGADSFTYHASDGALDSNIVAVNITVNAVSPALLVNGSFEAGQTGWTMSGNFLVYDSNPPYAAFDGVKMVVFNGAQTAPNAVISQTFATVPGRTYVLDFNIGVLAANFSEQKLGITVTGGGSLLSATESVFGNGQANSVWTPKAHTFTADATTATLTFLDLSATSDGIDLLLDNVRLRAATVNTAPVAQGDSYSTNQGTALVIPAAGVLANDSDAESDPLTAILNASPAHGSLALAANGGFTYTPAGNYTGPDSFSYRASDGNLDSAVVTVNISVLPVNSAPVAVADTYSTNQDSPLSILAAAGVLSNDSDAQSDPLAAVLNSAPAHGTLALNADGGFSYSPAPGYSGADSFTYHASDGQLDSNVVSVTITVRAANTAPAAAADTYATNMDTPLVIPAPGMLANDTDAQSDSLTAVLDVGPSHGTLVLGAGGGFTYTPATGYTGADSFTYHANDGKLDSGIVTVSLTVNGLVSQVLVNGSFEANFSGWTASGNQTIETYTARDGVKEVAFNSRNLAPDGVLSQTFATVPGQTYALNFDAGVLSYVKKQQQLSVTVNGSALLLSRTFVLNGAGGGSIRWTSRSYSFIADGTSATLVFRDQSTVTEGIDLLLDNVRVNGPAAFPNAAPVAVADSFSVNKNTVLVVPTTGVLLNDTDPQSDVLTAVLDAGPAQGTLTLNATGGFIYQPNAGFTGIDSFTYHAWDGNLNSNTVAVSITVKEVVPGILVNPSFEAGFTGWTAIGNQTIESYPPTDGVKIVDFNSRNLAPNATLSQTFATTPGRTYSLTFDAGVLAYSTESQVLQVAVNGTASLLSQTITVSGVGGGITRWLPQSLSFVADSDSATLVFSDRSTVTNGIDLLLDNVRVLESAPVKNASALVVSPPPLTTTPSFSSTPEAFVLSMTAPLPGNYVLERSADLKTWEFVDSMDCDAQEPVVFYDMKNAQNTGKPQMFYRIGCRSSQ